MENWQNTIVKAEERERQLRQGLDRPFAMYVNTVNSDAETMNVSFYGTRDVKVSTPHPFVSGGAWIRAMPEYGASYVGIFRAEETAPQALSSIQRDTDVRIRSYRSGNSLYRPLMPGELDISSVGMSQHFFSRRPYQEERSGLLSRLIDQDRLVITDRGPIITRALTQNTNAKLGDEERFGIAYRSKNEWEVTYPKYRDNYIAEHFVDLRNPGRKNPEIFFDRHAGVVTDNKGAPVNLSDTGATLRLRDRYYATNDSPTSFEIDEKGNYKVQLSDQAQEGYILSVPAGKARIDVAKDENHTIGANYTLTVTKAMTHSVNDDYILSVAKKMKQEVTDELAATLGKWTATIKGDTTFKGPKMVFDSQTINLGGPSPSMGIMLFEAMNTFWSMFATIFNTHNHIGNLGAPTSPPASPIPTALTPDIKSTTTKAL